MHCQFPEGADIDMLQCSFFDSLRINDIKAPSLGPRVVGPYDLCDAENMDGIAE